MTRSVFYKYKENGGCKMKNFFKEWGPYLIIIIVVVFIRSYIITPVVVRGDSMDDTLKDGEVLFLSKINYRFKEINNFDIVVVKDLDGDFIIKRIIGVPGDNVWYKDNILYINGDVQEEVFTEDETEDFTLDDICEINDISCDGEIPQGMYLVLGDNRDVSADSRVKGLIKREQIEGEAVFRLWPFNKIGVIN